MAEENFLTYPEVDPNSQITVELSRVTFTNFVRNQTAYVYSDKGVNYFSANFVHLLTTQFSLVQSGAYVNIWALANLLNDYQNSGDTLYVFLCLYSGQYYKLYLSERTAGASASDVSANLAVNTSYYLKIVRDEGVGTFGTLYLYIYTDAARTVLFDTLIVTLQAKTDFRYIYALQSFNDFDVAYTATGYVEDLTIEKGEASVLPEVTQQTPTSITATTAIGNGYINSLGLSAVTAHGHCWATTTNPTTADSKVDKGAGAVGAFTSAVTGLTAGTYYYIRAYATNSYGTSYSSNFLFRSGSSSSLLEPNQIAVGNTTLLYTGRNGKRYYIQGVEF